MSGNGRHNSSNYLITLYIFGVKLQTIKLLFLNIMLKLKMTGARVQGAARLPRSGHERGVPYELEVPAHAGPTGGHHAQQGPRQQTQVLTN